MFPLKLRINDETRLSPERTSRAAGEANAAAIQAQGAASQAAIIQGSKIDVQWNGRPVLTC